MWYKKENGRGRLHFLFMAFLKREKSRNKKNMKRNIKIKDKRCDKRIDKQRHKACLIFFFIKKGIARCSVSPYNIAYSVL